MFKKHHPSVGASPGTLVIRANASFPTIRLTQYNEGHVREIEVKEPAELQGLLDPNLVNWIEVQGLGDEWSLTELGRVFDLHALTIEDIVNIPQRPKLENHEGHQLVVFRHIVSEAASDVCLRQVSLVIGSHFVITFHETESVVLDVVKQRVRRANSRLRQRNSDYLAYAILDTLVDGFYPALEKMGEELERLEDEVIDSPSPQVLKQLNRSKNRLANLRRVVWPLREVIQAMTHADGDSFDQDVCVFLRDTYDHCIQIVDVIEMYREMVTGLLNTYLSAVGQRTNDVMKVLTIMSSIFIPLTFIAGIYGMNFEHMPELQFRWSYPLVWTTMGLIVIGMLIFFRRQGWLRDFYGSAGQRREPRAAWEEEREQPAAAAKEVFTVSYRSRNDLRRAS